MINVSLKLKKVSMVAVLVFLMVFSTGFITGQIEAAEADYPELTREEATLFNIVREGSLGRISTEIGRDIIDLTDDQGASLLMHAAAYTEDPAVINYLAQLGSEVDLKDNKGQTALMYAAAYNNEDVIDKLLRNGADPKLRNNRGETALILAAGNNNLEVVEKLIAADADIINIRDQYGQTALHHAASFNTPCLIEALLDAGADISLTDQNNESAIIKAAMYNPEPAVLETLVDCGACLEDELNGMNLLMLAARTNQSTDVTGLLLELGFDIDAMTEDSETPLILATKYNDNPEQVQYLLDNGADGSIVDAAGNTAYDYAGEREDIKNTDLYWELNEARF